MNSNFPANRQKFRTAQITGNFKRAQSYRQSKNLRAVANLQTKPAKKTLHDFCQIQSAHFFNRIFLKSFHD